MARPQRQDSLDEQMLDLIRIAEREGMYDAADWLKDRWTSPRYRNWTLWQQMLSADGRNNQNQ